MLYSWVQHRLALYLEQLKKHLPLITEGGNLASVVEHCMVRYQGGGRGGPVHGDAGRMRLSRRWPEGRRESVTVSWPMHRMTCTSA